MSKFHTSHRIVPASDINYTAEARLVQNRAARGEPSAIRLGPIVFFSTAAGDAWMIDVLDGEAACLARAKAALPIPIVENPSKFGVRWDARHRFEDETFIVIESDGRTRTFHDYPVAQIRRLIDEYPIECSKAKAAASTDAARERLRRTGRNDPCPCGSGRKYKKCCLAADEVALAAGAQPVRRTESHPATSLLELDDIEAVDEDDMADFPAEAAPDADGPEFTPEVHAALDRIWDEFNRLERPTPAQLDAWLDRLLALPLEATNWSEVFELLAEKAHPDLPAVFRRIAAVLPPTKAAGAAFFYWSAMEEFVLRGRDDLVPEIAGGFRRLDRASYDADALKHMVLWALAAGRDTDALAMEEHFLPIMRGDAGLMPHAVPSVCCAIFELRVGLHLPDLGAVAEDVEALTRELHRDLGEDIQISYARYAAQVIRSEVPPREFQREDFDLIALADTDVEEEREDAPISKESRLHFEAMLRVAHEAWQFDGRPPGSAFRGVTMLVDAVFDDQDERRHPKKSAPESLLDCLRPAGMERRITRSARGMLGTNAPHAHLLIEAHADLLRFAVRHRLIAETEAAKSERNLAMLRDKLGFPAFPNRSSRT
jgi:hypothetical protein